MAAIPVMFFVRHLRYKNRLKLEVENPNENFVKFGESISDEIDQKRFRALYLPSVVISKGKSRSDLLGEGYYGRVVKVQKVCDNFRQIQKKSKSSKIEISETIGNFHQKLKFYDRNFHLKLKFIKNRNFS